MAEQERELVVDGALPVVQVGVAHAARLDVDQRLAGTRVGHLDGLDRDRLLLGSRHDGSDLVRHARSHPLDRRRSDLRGLADGEERAAGPLADHPALGAAHRAARAPAERIEPADARLSARPLGGGSTGAEVYGHEPWTPPPGMTATPMPTSCGRPPRTSSWWPRWNPCNPVGPSTWRPVKAAMRCGWPSRGGRSSPWTSRRRHRQGSPPRRSPGGGGGLGRGRCREPRTDQRRPSISCSSATCTCRPSRWPRSSPAPVEALAPGGTFLLVGHDRRNLTDGTVAPGRRHPHPGRRGHRAARRPHHRTAGEVERQVDTGDGPAVAIDTLVRARR